MIEVTALPKKNETNYYETIKNKTKENALTEFLWEIEEDKKIQAEKESESSKPNFDFLKEIDFENNTYRYNQTVVKVLKQDTDIKYKKDHLSFNFSIILPNGDFRLDFSETFRKLEELWTGNRNFTMLNEIRHKIL